MNLGAPGLAFETWETTNLRGRGTSRQWAEKTGSPSIRSSKPLFAAFSLMKERIPGRYHQQHLHNLLLRRAMPALEARYCIFMPSLHGDHMDRLYHYDG
jgi:hypothetical protein